MNVVIDPTIENEAALSDRVRHANSYLESRLGRFKDAVEARWAAAADRPGQLELKLRFTDQPPVEASGTFSADLLRPERYPGPRLRSVVNRLFGRRLDAHVSRAKQLLEALDREEALTGA